MMPLPVSSRRAFVGEGVSPTAMSGTSTTRYPPGSNSLSQGITPTQFFISDSQGIQYPMPHDQHVYAELQQQNSTTNLLNNIVNQQMLMNQQMAQLQAQVNKMDSTLMVMASLLANVSKPLQESLAPSS